MAKAQITTHKGTQVAVDGTSEEVAALVKFLEGREGRGSKTTPPEEKPNRDRPARKTRTGPRVLVAELLDGGYFKKPKGLGEIKNTLEEQGHFYPVTTLSAVVLRMVKSRDLRRG